MIPRRAARAVAAALQCSGQLPAAAAAAPRWTPSRGRPQPCGARRSSGPATSTTGAFRRTARIDGVTIVTTKEAAERALQELRRLKDTPHAWDTETADLQVGRASRQSPVTRGRVVCATCYAGPQADFGTGPRLFVDNTGPAEGLLGLFKDYFEDPTYKKVFHNYSFERHLLRRHGIIVRGYHADTLHLARLWDTSLASWEGVVQAKQARVAAEAEAESFQEWEEEDEDPILGPSVAAAKGPTSAAAPSRPPSLPVLGVRLGSTALDKSQWASVGRLHTSSLGDAGPSKEPSASTWLHLGGEEPKMAASAGSGYTLKTLAANLGLSTGPAAHFGLQFGLHTTAAQEAVDSPDVFPKFVQYSTADAELTYKLYERLRGELGRRQWNTAVHERPIEGMLRDPKLVTQILRKGSKASSHEQHRTGGTMMDLFHTYIQPLGECLADMEEIGIGVDVERLQAIQAQASRDVEACTQEFVEQFSQIRGADGRPLNESMSLVNTRSAMQLRTLLFGGAANKMTEEQLGTTGEFPAPRESGAKRFQLNSLQLEPSKRTSDYSRRTGWPLTSREVLARLAKEVAAGAHGRSQEDAERIAAGLRQLGELGRTKTIVSNFAKPLQEFATEAGRIHPSWQFDTSTGRLVCRSPALQNLPTGKADRYGLRSAIRPEPGKVFVIADYSQLELVVVAHVANCESMISKLTRGGDYHSEVAAEIFQNVRDAVKRGEVVTADADGGGRPTVKERFPQERSKAKAINFGMVYGKTPASFAEELGIPVEEANELISLWFKSKPGVERWIKKVRNDSCSEKRVVSLLGRWRNLPLIDKTEGGYKYKSMRAAVNFGVQGSAADVVTAAMLRLWRHKRLQKLGFRLVLQVHDEFVLEGPEGAGEEALEIVREVMVAPFGDHNPHFRLRVPLRVDARIGRSLGGE